MKQAYNQAERFEDAAKYAYSVPAEPGSMGGGMGGMGGPMAGRPAASARTPIVVGTSAAGIGNYTNNLGIPATQGSASQIQPFNAIPQQVAGKPAGVVRNLGVKTFYRKGDRWVDSEVKPEEDAKAIVVEQFSDEFFKLARTQSAEQNQYFTFEEPVTVRIDGKVYRVDPPKAK